MTCAWRSSRIAAVAIAMAACGPKDAPVDPALEGLAITALAPATVVPGSRITVTGRSFVDAPWGAASVHLFGNTADGAIDIHVAADFVDYDHLEIAVTDLVWDKLGGEGDFAGHAQVEIESGVTGETYRSAAIPVSLAIRAKLIPTIASLDLGEVAFVNDPVTVTGNGLLLGGGEGDTVARVSGCFTADGATDCAAIEAVSIPVIAAGPRPRETGTFVLSPTIAGISPGHFAGEVVLENHHATGQVQASEAVPMAFDLTRPAVFSVAPKAASLGQYVDVSGGGFIAQGPGSTVLYLDGTFTIDGGPSLPVSLILVPEVVAGRTARYVLSEDDSLGQQIDLRTETGTFAGTLTPEVTWGGATVNGDAVTVSLSLAPVKQVVYVRFLPSYVEALRKLGMRAVDRAVRDRVMAVLRRDYAGINLEVRESVPEDFALYATVDIAGADPNGLGLLGYDNSPGKDRGNQRLYDSIGGVNATTQQDGFPGYGGIFIESLLLFSETESGDLGEPAFDDVFDPFREVRGGTPVRAADVAGGVPVLDSGDGCPAGDRPAQLGCAIWVLGSLIGTTASHELGHSLGLANPYGDTFHNAGDGKNRLMDAGNARPFAERAELFGEGPGRFCDTAYAYLRDILPTGEPADPIPRPKCPEPE